MENRGKTDKIIDAISWGGILLLWVAVAFLRFIQSIRPGALGNIGKGNGSFVDFFIQTPFTQTIPALTATVLFIILTAIIRSKPGSLAAIISRYLRIAVLLAAICFTVYIFR